MANWVRHEDYCYSKRMLGLSRNSLEFADVDLKVFRRLSKVNHGGSAMFQTFSLLAPTKEQNIIPIESTVMIYAPRRMGVIIEVSSDQETWITIPGSDYFGRLVIIKHGAFAKVYSNRSATRASNVVFLYNQVVNSPEKQDEQF